MTREVGAEEPRHSARDGFIETSFNVSSQWKDLPASLFAN